MFKTILDSSAYASDSSVEELWGRDWLKTMFFCLLVCLFVFVCFFFFARALPPLLGGHDS